MGAIFKCKIHHENNSLEKLNTTIYGASIPRTQERTLFELPIHFLSNFYLSANCSKSTDFFDNIEAELLTVSLNLQHPSKPRPIELPTQAFVQAKTLDVPARPAPNCTQRHRLPPHLTHKMSASLLPQPASIDFGLASPPITAVGGGRMHAYRRVPRKLFTVRSSSLRASPYVSETDSDTPVIDGETLELTLERARLEFLVHENERLREQLINTTLTLTAQIEAWHSRLLLFEFKEMQQRTLHARQRRAAAALNLQLPTSLASPSKSAVRTSPAAPAVASPTESDDIYACS